MDIGDIKPIPEGFLSRLLQEFGLQWTHLVILSGVIFSSFDLQKYLNSGIWILGTVASFSLVFLFRHQITGNFPKVALFAGAVLVGGLLTPWVVLSLCHFDPATVIQGWSKLATLYIAAVAGIPIGTIILSYRAQEEFLRLPLPPVLATAAKSVSQSPFIHESVSYTIQLMPGKDHRGLILRFDVT